VRIDRLKAEYEIEVRWTAFPLHPETPEEGRSLEDLLKGKAADMAGMKERLKRAAVEVGLAMGEQEKTFNSRLAQELAKWAELSGAGDEFHKAVFHTYYVEGRNIGKIDELSKIAGSINLPEKEAGSVLQARTHKGAVDADWSRCHALGIAAIPTFLVGTRRIAGAVSYEALERFIKDSGAAQRVNRPL
jgi:predicted DsbA family dithiol-disulfide isomerase